MDDAVFTTLIDPFSGWYRMWLVEGGSSGGSKRNERNGRPYPLLPVGKGPAEKRSDAKFALHGAGWRLHSFLLVRSWAWLDSLNKLCSTQR